MTDAVKPASGVRTRRAQQAARTRQRIIDAAIDVFLERGYAAATIDAIAGRADVAVETVYSRFGNKAALVTAILEPAIVGSDDGRDILERPEVVKVRSTTDQRDQLHQLAALSRAILERTHIAHRILTSAAAADPNAAELRHRDTLRRVTVQRRYIDMLLANGPLRLPADEAAATYSALANPNTYALLVRDLGWGPDQFQDWLERALVRLLLT